jgi:hypothetical protein
MTIEREMRSIQQFAEAANCKLSDQLSRQDWGSAFTVWRHYQEMVRFFRAE